MKKHLFIILGLLVFSCAKGDRTNYKKEIIGAWAIDQFKDLKSDAEIPWQHQCTEKKGYYYLMEPDILNTYFYNESCDSYKLYKKTYEIKRNRLKITDEDKKDEHYFIIQKLSDSKLILGAIKNEKSKEIRTSMTFKFIE